MSYYKNKMDMKGFEKYINKLITDLNEVKKDLEAARKNKEFLTEIYKTRNRIEEKIEVLIKSQIVLKAEKIRDKSSRPGSISPRPKKGNYSDKK